jgi:succinoglycan biosynthesis transport protein ExoP
MLDRNTSRGYGFLPGAADSYTIARRPPDLGDYLDILRRHLHWVLGPAFLGLVGAVVVAFLWPDTYVSEATIRILPPQVPQNLIPTGLSSQMAERINAIQQQVLSRDGLEEIIRSHNLYPDEVKRRPMADVVDEMRARHIRIEQFGTTSRSRAQSSIAYRIRYSYQDKYAAQKVVRDIVDKFIRLTNQGQFDRASSTTQFLVDQVTEAKRELDAIEEELTRFRLANQGRLPDQTDANLTQLRMYHSNLDSLNERINRLGQEKILLESQLATLREQVQRAARPESSMQVRVKSERLIQNERQLAAMRTQLSGLLERYTESHPDVRRLQGQIEVMERLRNEAMEEEARMQQEYEKNQATRRTTGISIDPQTERQMADLEAKINLLVMSIDRDTKQQALIQRQIDAVSARVESRPLIEQEYARLTRDYNLAKSRYDDLSRRRSISEMVTDLENRKQSELLEMLDQPSLPQKPTDPNRLLIIGAGLGLGVFAGLCLVGVREIKDGSLKNLKDVRLYSNMAVLGSIPLLENDLVVRRKRRLIFLGWTTALLLGLGAMSSAMYYYYFIARR